MPKPVDAASEPNLGHNLGTDRADIDVLIGELRSHDGVARQQARNSLVTMGSKPVASLVQLLADPEDQVRWEAAKALGEIGDPSAASALVMALGDESFGVRWLAAEGLIGLRKDALRPLLGALEQDSGSILCRQGAHHVLSILAERGLRDQVTPVLAALEGVEPETDVPLAARKALRTL